MAGLYEEVEEGAMGLSEQRQMPLTENLQGPGTLPTSSKTPGGEVPLSHFTDERPQSQGDDATHPRPH